MSFSYFVIFILGLILRAHAIGPLVGFGVGVGTQKCEQTLTTASGSHAIHKPNGQFCSGDLIFEDTFDTFDLRKWQHENTLSGNGVIFIIIFFSFIVLSQLFSGLAISMVHKQSLEFI